MKRTFLLIALLTWGMIASAQINLILGDWKTVDDKTGDNYSMVTIYKASDGLYYGKISQILVGPQDQVCTECKDADYHAPMKGLIIIRGMQYDKENNQLVGGKVLDPLSGKFYYGKIYPKDGKLVLRGSLDKRGFIGRNQTWIR